MAHPLAARLIELKPTVAVLTPEPEASGARGAPPPVEDPGPPEPDLDTLLAEAFARGVAQGEAGAAAVHGAALEAAEARAAELLAMERARWADEEGARLAALLTELAGGIEERIAAGAARVLRPFLDEAVRDRALAGLMAALDTILRGKPAAAIALTGPADLGEALLRRLPAPTAERIRFTPGEGIELLLTVDDLVVETQLASWSRALREPAV
ncbi:hypothetical protein [Salinarimonas soli]|uniref:Flagellar assembly protein FliH/Type III secretion system HrpE domain-containing protein n=1 Tax=Salinarimonas soli TaxID=1638099 RepID=A0A5B2VEG9_9HYPH|nr:hypothetical protein [Salinarimonas soli]KAA2237374.1 hypothetical protein F0L46_10265 [Salinarimonas soli]